MKTIKKYTVGLFAVAVALLSGCTNEMDEVVMQDGEIRITSLDINTDGVLTRAADANGYEGMVKTTWAGGDELALTIGNFTGKAVYYYTDQNNNGWKIYDSEDQEVSEIVISEKEYPNMAGFSYRNLRYIRRWYLFYSQDDTIMQQLVPSIWQQPVAKLTETFFAVPWGHHLYIISKCKEVDKAVFFLRKTIENSWSRSMLLNFLDTDLYERQGASITNFRKLLPESQSDLAQQTLKDPYIFDFLTLTEDYRERELEDALTRNITRFLLELGQGFAFVGRQVPFEVGDETIFVDLLFYHLELRCYVVIELKTTKFKAEHLGQLGLYVSAVNHLKKRATDNETIGLLICKNKNDVMAQYALESTKQPIGISEYQLSNVIPGELKSKLPNIEDIEASIVNISTEK